MYTETSETVQLRNIRQRRAQDNGGHSNIVAKYLDRIVSVDDLFVESITPQVVDYAVNLVREWGCSGVPELLLSRRATILLYRQQRLRHVDSKRSALEDLVWDKWKIWVGPIPVKEGVDPDHPVFHPAQITVRLEPEIPSDIACVVRMPFSDIYGRTLWLDAQTFPEPSWRLDAILEDYAKCSRS